jgi:hypothetical protein
MLTPEGYDTVKREIEDLPIPKRRRFRVAGKFGDINEARRCLRACAAR